MVEKGKMPNSLSKIRRVIPKYYLHMTVYIYLGVQFLSYERNCSYANPAHVSKFAHGQD